MLTDAGREEFRGGGRPRSGSHPVCESSFFAAHRLAREEWHAWVADQAATARLVAEAKAARGSDRAAARPRGLAAAVAALRRAIGEVLIGAGRRVQGTASASAAPEAAPADGTAT
jgi:hypothetical protein